MKGTKRSYTKHTILRMCAKDKTEIKQTFRDIKDFITSGPSRISRSVTGDSTPATGAPAGVGVASHTGPLLHPGAPQGPLEAGAAVAGQEQREQEQQEGGGSHSEGHGLDRWGDVVASAGCNSLVSAPRL